jgi:hypothetical protein
MTEALVLTGLAVAGLVQAIASPRKTYRLLAHGTGWYA